MSTWCVRCNSDDHMTDKCPELFTHKTLKMSESKQPPKTDASGFMECPVCMKLPGSPPLCISCLTNRNLIEQKTKPEVYGCNSMLKEMIENMRFVNKCYKDHIEYLNYKLYGRTKE